MRATFTGVGTALVTPFTKTGALDEAAVRQLARRQVDAGVHVLVPCGTTGETPTLSSAERARVVEIVAEEAEGRSLVLAGAGGYDTREVIHAAEEMAVHGRYGKPCPRCGAPVQRIRYADNETNYCAPCQTGGKLLADRALSRLLKGE